MSDKIKYIIDEGLYNFYKEADSEIIKELLKNDVSNLEDYEKRKRKLIFLAKAKAKKQHNKSLVELANKFQEGLKQNLERPIALLKQMIQENSSYALYRNLDKLSQEDIIEIIKDKNFIELLEKLENDKQKE